jgi:K+-transporting ATPase A subunit
VLEARQQTSADSTRATHAAHALSGKAGVDEEHEMRWTEYALTMLLFSGASMLLREIRRSASSHWLSFQNFSGLSNAYSR